MNATSTHVTRQPTGVGRTARTARVLLAEDDDDIRMELAEALAADGYLVIEARDGDEFLNSLIDAVPEQQSLRAYDAIITDVVMPGFSGIDVLLALRRSTAFIPVILVTAYADERTMRAAERLGVVALFRKPFDLNEILGVLATSLSRDAAATPSTRPPIITNGPRKLR
jgi:DNA-binding response OmpR family regulator